MFWSHVWSKARDFSRARLQPILRATTDRELAAAFGVSRTTIFRWRAAYPEFAGANGWPRTPHPAWRVLN
ncbi:helix-turn-helix domain-containing protein [Sphingomonas alpina]|uniref:Helix-turn-helix domain-containing protein n=1 Tax=Sphingomonas alpina TaxID=653931 RepID=A0A7H0LR97_9SPHN|nr:helix-turn-helix domain-containing protein [Sphingomonas alpina]